MSGKNRTLFPVDGQLECRCCSLTKPLSEFYERPLKSGLSYDARCKACQRLQGRVKSRKYKQCHRAEMRLKRQSPPGRESERRRRWRNRLLMIYKITPEEYTSLLEKQGGGCAVCGSDNPRRKGSSQFAVDHCHRTGRVRGLLCMPCNVGLGSFRDSRQLLLTAAAYLGIEEAQEGDRLQRTTLPTVGGTCG